MANPTGQDNNFIINEDAAFSFKGLDPVATFGFADGAGDNDTFKSIVISGIVGKLFLDGVELKPAPGAPVEVMLADIGKLVYVPPTNLSGLDAGSISFKVKDSADEVPQFGNAIFFDINSVNDAPFQDINLVNATAQIGKAFSYTIPAGAFTDPDGPAPILTATLADGSALPAWLDFTGGVLSSKPGQNPPAVGTLTIKITASDGVLSTYDTFTLTIDDKNVSPSGTSKIIDSVPEGGSYTFAAADFGYTDPDGNAFKSVIITQAPAVGTLLLNGQPVGLNTPILVADIGKLVWTPPAEAFGNGLGALLFKVVDDGGENAAGDKADTDASENFILFNVGEVADAPALNGALPDATALIGDAFTYYLPVNSFTDADGINTLTYSLQPATVGGVLPAWLNIDAATGKLFGTPTGVPVDINVKIVATDGTAQTVFDDIKITVKEPNAAPTGTDNLNVAVTEDVVYVLKKEDFGFFDADGDAFKSVLITDTALNGTLTLDGRPVRDDRIIQVADIVAGKLKWISDLNDFGNDRGLITFQVQADDGKGGIATDLVERKLAFDVAGVDDEPTGKTQAIQVLEDKVYNFKAADFGYFDAEGEAFATIKITSLIDPTKGTLKFNGSTVVKDQVINAADIGKLTFSQAVKNANGTNFVNFDFIVTEAVDPNVPGNVGLSDPTADKLTLDVVDVMDFITGNTKKNNLVGTVGTDTLNGGKGNDTLKGDLGQDIFVFKTGYGRDKILDFDANNISPNHDVVDLTGAKGVVDIVDLKANHAFQVGFDVVIKVNATKDWLTISNMTLDQLDASDFVFAI